MCFGTSNPSCAAGETLLEEVVVMAAKVGLVKPQDHIVCVQRMGESFVIKIVSVNDSGDGVEIIRPKSLINLIRVSNPPPPLGDPLPDPPSCMGVALLPPNSFSGLCFVSFCCFWLLLLFCSLLWLLLCVPCCLTFLL